MELAKTYEPKEVEDKLYKRWMENGYFHAKIDPNKTPYTIVIPPPNITGQLHMGHALDNTLQDILIRMKRMQGYSALWLPGTDHASIATEARIVEKLKEEGVTKEDLGREKFLERAWEWKKQYGGRIVSQLKKLGSSCDWERERFTMDEGLSKAVTEVFVRLYEKGVRTRSFSIIGSPNILGSVMTLLIPMSLALFFEEKKTFKKLVYLGMTGFMGLCLIFTQSRGAWIGFGVAILAFFLIYDRRYILPAIAAGLLVFIMVPQVYDRIVYMLSEEYILSSMTGGRLVRWQTGMNMLKQNLWLGTGIGRFGGAVAMNHKDLFPDTFYMDNYYLKTAVEGGIFAFLAFAALMISVLRWSFGALTACKSQRKKTMIVGMLSGLIGIVVHNFFENVFEVPAMVTYFWIVAAMIVYAGFGKTKEEAPKGKENG